jgi:RNA polymerase sigma-70 factor (ECF subfamily)
MDLSPRGSPGDGPEERRDATDEDGLAKAAAAGDAGAFDALVRRFAHRVFAVAARMLRDQGEAEDLTQEVFVALHRALPTFRGESKVSTWIYQITRNRCLNRLKFNKRRHVGRHADVDDPGVAHLVVAEEPSRGPDEAHARLARRDVSTVLEQHLRALPEEQRTLVILRDLEDLSYEEIADVTGLPLGTVKSRLHRARAELSRQLAPILDALE